MTRIPFIEARFFDPHDTQRLIEERLMTYLRRLRVADLSIPIPESEEDDVHAPSIPLALSEGDRRRISRRAKRLLELREAASGLNHLKRDDRERLEVLREGARLIQIPTEHRADELAATLHAEMPWIAALLLREKPRRIAVRDIQRRGQAGLLTAKQVETAAMALEQADWLRRIVENTGGRPRAFYVVNPKVWGEA